MKFFDFITGKIGKIPFLTTRCRTRSRFLKPITSILVSSFRILSTYVIWRSIKDSVPLLSKRFRDVHQMFKKRLLGSKSKKNREEICFSYTNNILGPMLGAVFIRNAFKPESKEKVLSRFLLDIRQGWFSGFTIIR